MSLTPSQARDAIQDAFNSGWGIATTLLTPISYDNIDFSRSTLNTAWVRLSVQFTTGSIQTLGAINERTFRNFGIVFVQIFTPIGTNATKNDSLAQTAKDIFKGVQLAGGLWFRNVDIRTIGIEGKWFQQNVSAEFIYDEVG